MCTGMAFCGSCRDEEVEAWSAGRLHQVPVFGDNAQRYTAISRRKRNFFYSIYLKQNMAIWPEWGIVLKHMGAVGVTPTEVIEEMPLPTYLTPPQKGASGQRWRKYERSLGKWYSVQGGAYRMFIRRAKRCLESIDYESKEFSLQNDLILDPELQVAL